MQREHVHSSPFSNEAIAFAAEARHWIARHNLLVIMGTTTMALGFCSLGSLIVHEITNNYIPDIHKGPLPLTLYIGSYSRCKLRPDQFNGMVPVMRDNGGITVGVIPGHNMVIHHAPEWRECTPPDQWR